MVSKPKRKVLLQIPQGPRRWLVTSAEVNARDGDFIRVAMPRKWQMPGGQTEVWINDAVDPIVLGWT